MFGVNSTIRITKRLLFQQYDYPVYPELKRESFNDKDTIKTFLEIEIDNQLYYILFDLTGTPDIVKRYLEETVGYIKKNKNIQYILDNPNCTLFKIRE